MPSLNMVPLVYGVDRLVDAAARKDTPKTHTTSKVGNIFLARTDNNPHRPEARDERELTWGFREPRSRALPTVLVRGNAVFVLKTDHELLCV